MTGALFENDAGIALRAVLTGEVIGFAFEAQVAPHLAKRTLETVLDDWCPSFPVFISIIRVAARSHRRCARSSRP